MPETTMPFPICNYANQQGRELRDEKKVRPGRTFRPRFVYLPTNDPFKSTPIMVIHNGLVYWDPWAYCPALTLSLPLLIFVPENIFFYSDQQKQEWRR